MRRLARTALQAALVVASSAPLIWVAPGIADAVRAKSDAPSHVHHRPAHPRPTHPDPRR